MNLRNSLKLLTAATVLTLGFAANANAVPVSGIHDADDSCTPVGGVVGAVPEADTWAMMAVGLGLVGLRLRRRKNKTTDLNK